VTQYIILLLTYIWYLCYCVELLDLLVSEFSYRFLVLLLWRQLRLYKLNLWWLEVYGVDIWGLSCLDYPLDVSISWIQSLSLYNWFCPHLYLKHYLIFYFILVYDLLTTQFLIHVFSTRDYHFSCVNLIPSSPLISWFHFMFLIIDCTCMPELHHLIMYICDYLSTPTGFILRTRWVIFWQPWTFMARSRSLNRGDLVVAGQSAQRKRELAVVCLEPLFFHLFLTGSWDSYHTTREYFSVFLYCISCFCRSWWSNILGILYHALW